MNFLQALLKVNKKPKISVRLYNRRRINLNSQILFLGVMFWVCGGGKAIAEPFSSCPAPAYLSQGSSNSTIKLYTVDLFSGGLNAISASDIPGGINGIGFNQLDGYIYGMKSGINNIVTRLDNTGVATDLGSITGLPTANYNVGDVDSNGVLHVSAGGGTIYGIDITPSSPNYLKVIKTITSVVSGIQDFAFHPTNGKLYTIQQSGGKIYEISWSSGANVTATNNDRGTPTALLTGSAYGGVFFAIDGSFYGYRNGTNGNTDGRIYRITNISGTGLPIATLITSSARGVSQNDGARCALAPPIYPPNTVDYGDAPDTGDGTGTGNYRTKALDNGPGHEIIAGLRIGTNVDGDSGSLQNTTATDDDGNGSPNDEDGVASFPTLYTDAGASYSVSVKVTNTTGSAYLVGYIDFNKDGDFDDANEKSTIVNVPNNPTGNQTVVFTTPAGMRAGNTYARFRLSNTSVQAESSVGIATSGEVEDYQVAITGYDYGDAPAGYENNNSARHVIVSSLRLGDVAPDDESAAQSSANADGDDAVAAPNLDDEDGISTFPSLSTNNTSYSLTAKVNNTSGNAANVYGWLDFDHDGKFDGDERATVSNDTITLDSNSKVPTGSNGTVTLTWSNLGSTGANIIDGNSYARIRLTTDNLSAASATTTRDSASVGNATNGEVEDYPIAIASAISPLAGQLVINEVLYNETGTGAAGNDEFIELYNTSSSSINLNGLKLFDGNLIAAGDLYAEDENFNGTKKYYTFGEVPSVESGSLILQPGQYAVVWIGARNSGGSQLPERFTAGATFQAWLNQDPKLRNAGDDVWLYDANTKIIDYMAYGTGVKSATNTSGAINTRPNSSLNLWNDTHENKLDVATNGQSISLTPNGIDGNSSACWEKTAILTTDQDSAKYNNRCTGFLNTIDTDIAFITPNQQRVTSVGKNNNQLIQDFGDAPTGYELSNSARHNLSTNLYLGNVFPDNESAPQSSANGDGDDAVAAPNLDDEDGITSFPTLRVSANSYTLTTTVNNPSGLAAKVYAWIDFDRDQKFDQDERATVVNTSISGNITLIWNNIGGTGANISNGSTSMRIRLTTSGLDQTTETTQRDDASIGLADNGEVEDYPIAIAQASNPNLLLVKRITAINPGQPSAIQFDNFIDDIDTLNDNNSKWPDSNSNHNDNINAYLRGVSNYSAVKPGDEVEYTIYFLSNGDVNAKEVKICDAVSDHMTFVKNTYGVELGIGLGFDSTVLPTSPNLKLSNLLNDDQGDFYAPNTTPPANLCKKADSTNILLPVNQANNNNGAIVVKIQDLPKANTPGSPTNSYGFIRFRGKVK